MSAIDQYKHRCIGIIDCPSTYPIVLGRKNHGIPIYVLEQDVPSDELDFDGKKGDILIGGGSGEASVLRISIPEALFFFTHEDWNEFYGYGQVFKAFWSMNEAYVFCDGYHKLGWNPNEWIEMWITKHVICFLKNNYYENYCDHIGTENIEHNGLICRIPTEEEIKIL